MARTILAVLGASVIFWTAGQAHGFEPVLTSHHTETRAVGGEGIYLGVPSLRVHPGAKVRIALKYHAARVKVSLECGAVTVRRYTARKWSFRVPPADGRRDEGCLAGRLNIWDGTQKHLGSRYRYRFWMREHSHAPACDPPGSETIAINDVVRVYTLVKRPRSRFHSEEFFFACRFDIQFDNYMGLDYYGDAYDHAHTVWPIRLVDDKLAYVTSECDCRYGSGRQSLTVRDTRTWAIDHEISGGYGDWQAGGEGDERGITDVELRPTGSVAWIVYKMYWTGEGFGAGYEVRKADASGTDVLLDAGDIAPESLTLTGTTLSWLRAGQPQSAWLE